MIESISDFQYKVFVRLGEAGDLLQGPDPEDDEHEVAYAVQAAIQELRLTFPLSDETLEFWALERGKRHAYDIIRSSSAKKFRYKQIHMQQRFEHFNTIIEKMDADFAYALETNAALAGVDSELFFTFIRPGFVYDKYGRDFTYKV